ncbi:MFS transporter [Streptomyces olivaceoviridis]|uniref:MFS transporter n=1 Tax=Streptomyces olivaceoviridis TaxID=1921 RepID=UPI0036FF4324
MTAPRTTRGAASPPAGGVPLRENRVFRAYWVGEAVTLAGTSVHGVALPVIAVLELDASPGQVSLLAATATVPAFVLALPAGVAGDRYPKKRITIGTDLAAAAVVPVVPVCWAAGALSVPVLYAVALLLGALTVLHQAASTAIVPELVDRAPMHPANATNVRVSGPGADPIDWRLLDGSHPDNQEEWLDLIHSDESILLQRDGEPLRTLPRGPSTGGHMTSMSTYTPATVEALQAVELGPGQRYLELGPGPGVSLALAATVTGLATGVEQDGHMTAFAQRNLDRLGVGATVVKGDALEGHKPRAPYDRIHSGIGVPCVPAPRVEQLAPGGSLPWQFLDGGRQDEGRLQRDATALRALLGDA